MPTGTDKGRPTLSSSFGLLSIALITYGASAFVLAASAGSFAAVIAIGGGPTGVVLDRLANSLGIVGIGPLGGAVVLLVLSFRRMKVVAEDAPGHFGQAWPLIQGGWILSWVLVGIALVLGVLLIFARGTRFEGARASFGLASGFAALSFLAAISIPALIRTKARQDTVFWVLMVAVALGAVGVSGEMALMLPPLIRIPSWITLGGFPLLNWNLPFGALVGTSALLISLSYRVLARKQETVERRGPNATHLSAPRRP
ncbi:MAG: hypothetical protein LN413_04485 [Candidatus Thermoplasmatota archaeon]|nr:hypothetical protein [Candidatus Thermoplasmatota archaeon]